MKKLLIIGGIVLTLAGGAAFVYFKFLKKSVEHTKLIPANSFIVMQIDLLSMSNKIKVKELQDLFLFKKIKEEQGSDSVNTKFFTDVLSNPLNMGIDPLSDLYLVADMRGEMTMPDMAVIFSVRDAGDFEDVLMKLPEKNIQGKKEVVSKDGYKTFRISPNALIAWKNGAGMLVAGTGEDTQNSFADRAMKQEPTAALTENEFFKEFIKKDQDIGLFINYGGLLNSSAYAMLIGGQTNEYYEALTTAYTSLSLNFEKDKISTKGYYYNKNKEAAIKANFLTGDKLSSSILKSLTNKKPFGFIGVSFNVEKFLASLEKNPQTKGMGDIFSDQTGLTFDEIKKLTNGEIVASMNDFSMQPIKRMRYDYDEKLQDYVEREALDTVLVPEFSVAVGINNKANLEKMLNHFKIVKDAAGYYKVEQAGMNYYFVENTTGITITNSLQTAIDLVAKKEYENMISGKAGEIAGSAPSTVYFNMALNEYPEIVKTSFNKEMGDASFRMFSDFVSMFLYFEAKGDSKEGESTIFLTPGEDNSLWRIIKQIDKLFMQLNGEMQAKMEAEKDALPTAEELEAVVDSSASK